MNTQGYTVELKGSAVTDSAVAFDALISGANKPEPQHLWR
jgi:hypothetical protein